ncbi:LANO_0A01310g1_1 [Lachancea nothofagi CBS 11611]|uniref:LANO_0A01310g1_1 n=1 Tax=Lachancea nothofagi CBS 11611 TaxID=1266666 RepID=A0A1G4IMF5_9SACH|nr:LANO_0A01310g1_1 [Lachancea nothofagi CBS 11611]
MNTDKVNNKLELASHFFLIYLGHSGLLADDANVHFKEISKKNIELTVNVNGGFACSKNNGDKCDELEVIFMDISSGEKCMISVCCDDESVKQARFNYEHELFIDSQQIEFPLDKTQVMDYYTPNLDSNLESKFNLRGANLQETDRSGSSAGRPSEYEAVHQRLEKLKFGNPQLTSHRRKSIPDMPGFDDELEVRQEAGIPVTGTFGVPGLASDPSKFQTGYGDQDLYPGGQKYPNLQDPRTQFPEARSQPPGQGGMIFDPFRGVPDDSRSNPLRGGPSPGGPKPPFPGAKFDDPFGRQGYQGGGGGFI